MKRTLFVITALLLILALGLAACGGGDPREAAPSLTPTREPVVGEKVFGEATPSLASTGNPVSGEKIFVSACAACHGKDMTQNDFIATKTNQELVEFIKIGGVPDEPLIMLPKAGNPSLTDENLYDIVAYIRSLQK